MDFFLIWIFPTFLLGVVGLIGFLSTNKHIKHCEAISGWVTTRAIVEKTSIEQHITRKRYAGSRISNRRVTYQPKIEYSYEVIGTSFRSDAFQNFAGTFAGHSEDEAARVVAAYPAGKEVSIRYNPENPAEAYLLPQTDTTRLLKIRTGQVVMIIIALAWFAVGSLLNLVRVLNEKNADKQIHASAALLPFTTQEINAKMDTLVEKYQLDCQDESAAGQELKYYIRACRGVIENEITSLELYYRQEAPQKADCISSVYTPTDQEKAVAFFEETAGLVFSSGDLFTVHDWLAGNIQKVTTGNGDVDLTISEMNLALDNLGGTVRLNIGALQ